MTAADKPTSDKIPVGSDAIVQVELHSATIASIAVRKRRHKNLLRSGVRRKHRAESNIKKWTAAHMVGSHSFT